MIVSRLQRERKSVRAIVSHDPYQSFNTSGLINSVLTLAPGDYTLCGTSFMLTDLGVGGGAGDRYLSGMTSYSVTATVRIVPDPAAMGMIAPAGLLTMRRRRV